MKKRWTLDDMPNQSGKTVLITGANDGLGYHMTEAFARKGATVIMACRNSDKANAARARVLTGCPHARLEIIALDLADLESVAACAEIVVNQYPRLDIVMCNAGIMAVPYQLTRQGIEMQMGVNYYGHYALVGRLLSVIKNAPAARVVTTTSLAQMVGSPNLTHQVAASNYHRWLAYGDSKLALIVFALSLNERFRAAGLDARALTAHPGFAATSLRTTRLETEKNPWERLQLRFFEILSMPGAQGALPLLFAATDPRITGGEFVGLDGFLEIHGYPRLGKTRKLARSPELAEALWKRSEELTGVRYRF